MRSLLFIAVVLTSGLISCGRQTQETRPIRKDVTEMVFASGTLEAEGTYRLTARADGYITELSFTENDLIQKGQPLAVIDNPQNLINARSGQALFDIARANASPDAPALRQASNALEQARQQMEFNATQVARYKQLLEANSISRADYEKTELQYQTSRTEYENARQHYTLTQQQAEQQVVINRTQKEINTTLSGYNQIRAVKAGRVLQKFKQAGDFVGQGEVIALIGEAGGMYASVNVDEGSIGKVKVGQPAVIGLNISDRKTYRGEVARILPTFDQATQSFVCHISFIDSLDFDIAGTQLQVNIVVDSTRNALLIPRNYLSYDNQVQVKGEDKPRKIDTRLVSSEWVQVLSGIDENTVLVTENIP
jgi:HlyD family secretion protein